MQMFQRCYAPVRVRLEGELPGQVDALATRSEDGKRLYVKPFSPTDDAVRFAVRIAGRWQPEDAQLRWVAAESLRARNTLDEAHAIREKRRRLRLGDPVQVAVPAECVAVLCLERRPLSEGGSRTGLPACRGRRYDVAGRDACAPGVGRLESHLHCEVSCRHPDTLALIVAGHLWAGCLRLWPSSPFSFILSPCLSGPAHPQTGRFSSLRALFSRHLLTRVRRVDHI